MQPLDCCSIPAHFGMKPGIFKLPHCPEVWEGKYTAGRQRWKQGFDPWSSYLGASVFSAKPHLSCPDHLSMFWAEPWVAILEQKFSVTLVGNQEVLTFNLGFVFFFPPELLLSQLWSRDMKWPTPRYNNLRHSSCKNRWLSTSNGHF